MERGGRGAPCRTDGRGCKVGENDLHQQKQGEAKRRQSPARGELHGGGYESSSSLTVVDPTRRAGSSGKTLHNGGKNARCTIWIDAADTDIAVDVATSHHRRTGWKDQRSGSKTEGK